MPHFPFQAPARFVAIRSNQFVFPRFTPRRMRACVAVALVAHVVGCTPVYRAPKRTDLFRLQPTKTEPFAGPIVAPPGLPLPPVPPVTAVDDELAVTPDPNVPLEERSLTLEEAIRISLSNSGVVRVIDGNSVSIAQTPFDPYIFDARLREAMAAFDPSITSSIYSNWINQPPDAIFGPGLAEPTRRDEAGVTAAITKPWLTGTETRLGYNPPLNYLFIPDPSSSSLNPLWTSNLEFTLRQPLLKGLGIGVNKAPIRVAQIRRDQSALEVRQAVMASVRSVNEAYWELYASRKAYEAIDQVVPLLQEVARIEEERMAAQRSVRADVAKAYSQLHAVRRQAVEARSEIVQRELRLRNLLGLPPSDGCTIVPISDPLEAMIAFDPVASTQTAERLRPDLIRQRLAVQTREQELLVAKNSGLPQFDASGTYRWNGVGNALDDSISQMFGENYNDWQALMTFSMPIGRRAGAAGIRAATLQLARERAVMQQVLHSTTHQINSLIQDAAYTHELFMETDARLKANTVWLEGAKIRYENPPPSGDDWLLAATNDYLTALRSQADAASDMQGYLARYNTLLARLNEATGTILSDFDIDMDFNCAPDIAPTTGQLPPSAPVAAPSGSWGQSPAAVPQTDRTLPPMSATVEPPEMMNLPPSQFLPNTSSPNVPTNPQFEPPQQQSLPYEAFPEAKRPIPKPSWPNAGGLY